MMDDPEEQPAAAERPSLGPVVNVGLEIFADALKQQSIEVIEVRWRPPASVPADIASMLEELL